jgi:(1->4)-alpha-D-glucan 1-alpha-D-glucosylmutase
MRARPTVATYRVQVQPDFDLRAVARAVPYLVALGVDTLYLSPLLAARAGSTQGYDVIDPTRADPPRGGEAGLRTLARRAHAHDLRILLDIVPNHLAATPENPWWQDVLRRGPGSRYARVFDVDWKDGPGPRPRVTLPVLSTSLDEGIRTGRIALRLTPRALRLDVEGEPYPVEERATTRFLRRMRARLRAKARGPRNRPALRVADSVSRLRAEMFGPGRRPRRLHELAARVAAEFCEPGPAGSQFELARAVLDEQHYRLVPYWEVDGLNYRRFFDATHLVGVHVENPRVFRWTHRRVLAWVARGYVDGVRVDHIDGLAEPTAYLRRLRAALERARPERHPRIPIWVEKILAPGETLPSEWPVEGTTGYDAMTALTATFVDPRGKAALRATFRHVTGETRPYARVAFRARQHVVETLFRADTRRIWGAAARRGAGGPVGRERADDPAAARVALTSALPVYRTYSLGGRPGTADRRALRRAEQQARRLAPGVSPHLLRRVRRELEGSGAVRERANAGRSRRRTARRWQQWTPAVYAKGVEDTALYRYPMLVAANEVGADASRVGLSQGALLAFLQGRRGSGALSATTTHDSKWGEDVRMRLATLSELAPGWHARATSWVRWVRRGPGGKTVSATDIYLLLQALVGSRPLGPTSAAEFPRRFRSYALKAVREAKVHTGWVRPDVGYESAVTDLAGWLARGPTPATFRRELERWTRTVAYLGQWYSLGLTVLKVGAPGVPDLYQGAERSALHLVDPDNRRPVDFVSLRRSLKRLLPRDEPADARALAALRTRWWTGELKQYVTARCLRVRRSHADLFARGACVPLPVRPSGPFGPLAFAIVQRPEWVLVAVGRGLAVRGAGEGRPPIGRRWAGHQLRLPADAPTDWNDELVRRSGPVCLEPRGRSLPLATVFAELPVALWYGRSRGAGRPPARFARRAGPPFSRRP